MALVTPERIEYLRSTLTIEFFEREYPKLGTFKEISKYHNIPETCVKRYAEKVGFEYLRNRRNSCIDDFFASDTEDSFYIAGMLLADGCLRTVKINGKALKAKPGKMISFGLASRDRDLVVKIHNKLGCNGKINDKITNISDRGDRYKMPSYCSSFQITSEKMYDDLTRFGLSERKSLTAEFPQWIKSHPLRSHYIRGLFDGDGSWGIGFSKDKNGNKLQTRHIRCFLCGPANFLLDVEEVLIDDLGLKKKCNGPNDHGKIARLQYQKGSEVQKIADYLYKDATIYLRRKYDIATSQYGPIPMTATQHKLQYLIDNNLPLPTR